MLEGIFTRRGKAKMMLRTHLTISLFFILILFSYFSLFSGSGISLFSKITFVAVVLIATYIPDIDAKKSKMGNHWYLRPLQFFTKHRGVLHSFSFLFVLCLLLILIYPVILFPFSLGYGSHLLADCLTVSGIQVFWPFKRKLKWKISTGNLSEKLIFLVFMIADAFLLANLIRF